MLLDLGGLGSSTCSASNSVRGLSGEVVDRSRAIGLSVYQVELLDFFTGQDTQLPAAH